MNYCVRSTLRKNVMDLEFGSMSSGESTLARQHRGGNEAHDDAELAEPHDKLHHARHERDHDGGPSVQDGVVGVVAWENALDRRGEQQPNERRRARALVPGGTEH